jgi:hypothetical protein
MYARRLSPPLLIGLAYATEDQEVCPDMGQRGMKVQRLWLLAVPSGIGLRIRVHATGLASAQELMMISHPSAQEAGAISRRVEHKSFISKPLESKTQFIAPADGMVTGLA